VSDQARSYRGSEHNPPPLDDYLRPTAVIASDVLLPGDPALALALAQRLCAKPLMANHSHGLWGYTGTDERGRKLTIQSTGIGGPSAAAVLRELAGHGARRAIRVGCCRALDSRLAIGSAVVVGTAVGADGASRALGVEPAPHEPLTAALARAADPAPCVTAASVDVLDEAAAAGSAWESAAPAVLDLETAALLAQGARLGLEVASALVVAETAGGERSQTDVDRALLHLGEAAAVALAADQLPASAAPSSA
jgi:uridine phosphorylase